MLYRRAILNYRKKKQNPSVHEKNKMYSSLIWTSIKWTILLQIDKEVASRVPAISSHIVLFEGKIVLYQRLEPLTYTRK